MSTSELFDLITSKPKWWVGYCSSISKNQKVSLHKRGLLTLYQYKHMFNHFGYIENIHWEEK